MLKRAFDPGFRIRLYRKDVNLALHAATALHRALPNTATTQQLMNAAIANTDAERDHSALIRTLEALSGMGADRHFAGEHRPSNTGGQQ